jgi:hypothetical protein
MTAASSALQQALFAALGADPRIKAALGDPPRIFDHVPRSTAFPYLVIGDDIARDWSTTSDAGSEHLLTLHVWSRAAGRQEARSVAGAIVAALTESNLVVAGHTLVDLRWRDSEVVREADGETLHARLRFRALLEPAA